MFGQPTETNIKLKTLTLSQLLLCCGQARVVRLQESIHLHTSISITLWRNLPGGTYLIKHVVVL